ncbi:hypothetical protein OIU91_04215 [Streptomyces sp. NBC_01456]|uniref:hypothetical protein n=1 Tax=unclassified Streptomyces TaxID=2593676 RepID=UPI002E30CD0E|nr:MULTISPECIES: hypothetical protein [unclassified Streptomyces]
MSAATEPVQPGQRWRRKSDRVLTRIISVDPPEQFRRSVLGAFLKKYELAFEAVPVDAAAQAEDAQLQQKLNTTRDGVLVAPGQIWEDLDSRQKKRRVVVVSVQSGRARVRAHYGTRLSTLSVSRMHKHSTGFRLVAPGELRYGAPAAPSDEETQR